MQNKSTPEKNLLTPSVIHDDLTEVKKPEHLRKAIPEHNDSLPENPERNYHHDEIFKSSTSSHDEIKHADDDVWNGEDA